MKKSLNPIELAKPGEEISKKDLDCLVSRFKVFNQSRFERVQAFLPARQEIFLNLLPLLFQVNHPLLPGFISLETPFGISNYQPSKQALDIAKQFSKAFVYKPKVLDNCMIYALFLMGSVGSMAFSKHSDIDIWLCYMPGLEKNEINKLQQKAYAVEKWAASLGLEVHFFLIDDIQFKQNENCPISKESSGETQHYLLLEEFYRSAIYIAGKFPIWWLVPPNQEIQYDQYVAHLLDNRFISAADVIDFGGLHNMPITEFVTGTLWQIYKSLNSPHKSLLKLMLMESYAAEFPNPIWLCVHLKTAIYLDEFSVESLDAYTLIYSKVDHYLKECNSPQRLQLARECFHLKIMGTVKTAVESKTRVLHEDYLRHIASEWKWPSGFLEYLELKKNWTIQKACSEHLVIREQLQNCLRIILKLTCNPAEHNYVENRDLKWINRKLRSVLDQRSDKIEVLTTRLMLQAFPETLTFVELENADGTHTWSLYTDNKATQAKELAIKKSDSLLNLLCWIIINGLYQKKQNLKLLSRSLTLSNNDFTSLLTHINEFLIHSLLIKDETLEVYDQPNLISSSLLIINLGEILLLDSKSQIRISQRFDPFSYGDDKVSLIQNVQIVSVTSWGEVILQNYQSLDGLLNCFLDVINNSCLPLRFDSFSIVCLTHGRGKSILNRVNSLLEKIVNYFNCDQKSNQKQFIIPAESGFVVFKQQDKILKKFFLKNSAQLMQFLANNQTHFIESYFDNNVFENSVIPNLYLNNLAEVIQIFCQKLTRSIKIYIIDEKGSLFVTEHKDENYRYIIQHYFLFLGSLIEAGKLPSAKSIRYYEINNNPEGELKIQNIQYKPQISAFELRIRITYDQKTETYAVFCNDLKITISNTDSLNSLKTHILSYRRNHDDYPFHITDLDVPDRLLGLESVYQAQAISYLNFKKKIEERLNRLNSNLDSV